MSNVSATINKSVSNDKVTPSQKNILKKLHGEMETTLDKLTVKFAKMRDQLLNSTDKSVASANIKSAMAFNRFDAPSDKQMRKVGAYGVKSGKLDSKLCHSNFIKLKDAMDVLGFSASASHVESIMNNKKLKLEIDDTNEVLKDAIAKKGEIMFSDLIVAIINHTYQGSDEENVKTSEVEEVLSDNESTPF
tara:strand:- start:2225 stop:2797 length:573 start_codon:yes stop_codon:yes gene_type:complete